MAPLAKLQDLKCVRPPIDIPPFKVTRIWHRRWDTDQGHAWLRGIAREAGVALSAVPAHTIGKQH
jgi:hypothetical protein